MLFTSQAVFQRFPSLLNLEPYMSINVIKDSNLLCLGYQAVGLCLPCDHNIVIAGSAQNFVHTLIHELIHMRQYCRGLPTRENGVNGAATNMLKAITRNKSWVLTKVVNRI